MNQNKIWRLPLDIKSKIKSLYSLIPKDFDYKIYLLLYPDLGEAGIETEEEAIEHYILFGKQEGRICQNIRPEIENVLITNSINNNNIAIKYKQKTINKLFDKIYVIALKKNNNKKLILQYLHKFGIEFEFIYGIDGQNDKKIISYYNDYLSWPLDDERRHPLDNNPYKRLILGPGAIALSLTYKKIFKRALKEKYNNILILEEDCLFDQNICLHLNNFMRFQKKFDLLFLGASHHSWKDPEIINIPNTTTSYYKAPYVLDGTFAIAYNCKILPDILKHIEKINSPIDSGPIRSILQNGNSYVIYPNIAIADTTPVSSISGKSRNLRNHKFNVRWNLSNISFTRGTLKNSILLANHNSEKTIRRCIKSVLDQTYPNFELIIVDDNSQDASPSIIKNYAKKDNRIKFIELDKNIGAYAARNIALENSSGFFVSMLDSDDILLSKKIEIDIYNYFNNSLYEIFFSNMYRCQNINLNKLSKDLSIIEAIEKEREPQLYKNHNNYIYGHNSEWKYKFRFGLPTIFVEKSFFDKYGRWNENHRFGMDLELIQRYIAIKYKEFIDHKDLWNKIYLYQAGNYGIFLSKTTNYISFPQNNNNATNICKESEREAIHNKCNKKLKQTLETKKKNKTEIFCMIKNEEDIIKHFIEYHLPIVDNITIIDNGSTDNSLEIIKKYPVKIISNTSSFKNKSLIISNLIQNSTADIALPMDVDEFLFLENNKKVFNKKTIKNYFSNLKINIGDRLKINKIYEICPYKKDHWDINTSYTKMIFAKDGFLAVDTGFHKGSTTTNNIKDISISYCHFHFRSKNRWIQNTKQKLQTRLGDDWNNIELLNKYSGDSRHCVDEWLRFIHTGEWCPIQPKIKFRFPKKMVFD